MAPDLSNLSSADLAVLLVAAVNGCEHIKPSTWSVSQFDELTHILSLVLRDGSYPLTVTSLLIQAQFMLLMKRPEPAKHAIRKAFQDYLGSGFWYGERLANHSGDH